MRALALTLVALFAVPAAAHPPPRPEEASSASEMLKKKKKTPYLAIAGGFAEDKQAYGREGYLDIKSVRVFDEDPLRVDIELFEAVEPEPGGLVVFLVPEGDKKFRYAAYLPEPMEGEGAEEAESPEWGLFALSGREIYEDRAGSASYVREDTVMTVTIPRSDIPLDDFLVHIHCLSGPDNDNLWKDEAPNERKGLGVPARTEEDVAGQDKKRR